MSSRRSIVVSISLPPVLHSKGVERARQLHMSFSEYVRYLIRQDLLNHGLLAAPSLPERKEPFDERLLAVKRAISGYSTKELVDMYAINPSPLIRSAIKELLRERDPSALSLLQQPHNQDTQKEKEKDYEEGDPRSGE